MWWFHETAGNSFTFFFFFNYFILFFKNLWLCWVFVSVRGLSLVAASGGHSSSRCTDLSLSRPLPLRSTGSRRAGSVVVAHGPSCSVACGIFPDQGSNPCPLHWQANSQPLRHQGSPHSPLFFPPHHLRGWCLPSCSTPRHPIFEMPTMASVSPHCPEPHHMVAPTCTGSWRSECFGGTFSFPP